MSETGEGQRHSVDSILPLLGAEYTVEGTTSGRFVTKLRAVGQADGSSLVFIAAGRADRERLLEETQAQVVICEQGWDLPASARGKCVIRVAEPKLCFARIGVALFQRDPEPQVHPLATLHPEADVHPSAYIGPYTYVGRAVIGEGSIIFGHSQVMDGVRIGKRLRMNPGCVLGSEGFGHIRDERGEYVRFPHVGGVIVEDDVEIGANTHVGAGALDDTVLGRGVKLDAYVHVSHNARIGQHTAIAAHTVIGGSTTVGEFTWISPFVMVRDAIRVGSRVYIGMGSVVTKDVEDDAVLTGSPARPLDQFRAIQSAIRRLAEQAQENSR